MRVLIDTNVLFSAAYRSGSVPDQAYRKAIEPPFQGLVCEQNLDELHDKFTKKFPSKSAYMDLFIVLLKAVVEVIPIPDDVHPDEAKLRDPDDAYIFRAAIAANADIIISGDLDFLESGITEPMIMTAAEFVKMEY